MECSDAIADREQDLYPRWERSAGRSLWGLEGRYCVIHQGRRNGSAGPDYLGASMVFPDGIIRRGDVEIHLRSSDWHHHRHQWDPRYRRVILHVIATGALKAVPHERFRLVPTVALPRETVSSRIRCPTNSQVPSEFSGQADFIRTLAVQRWWRRLADDTWSTPRGILEALARRLGSDRYQLQLPDLWLSPVPRDDDLFEWVSSMLIRLSPMAGGRQRNKLPGRLAFLSALAYMYHTQIDLLLTWSLSDTRQLVDNLRTRGLPLPTRQFVVETIGNWLLPLLNDRTGIDRSDEWYGLPLGWTYGRVKRHVERLGLAKPVCFGEQQGLLEWIESLCQPGDCACCPVGATADEC